MTEKQTHQKFRGSDEDIGSLVPDTGTTHVQLHKLHMIDPAVDADGLSSAGNRVQQTRASFPKLRIFPKKLENQDTSNTTPYHHALKSSVLAILDNKIISLQEIMGVV